MPGLIAALTDVGKFAVRVAAGVLTLSAGALAVWKGNEGTGPTTTADDGTIYHLPYVPTAGDVPTIGYGSTRYEDGRRVRLSDPPITRERAERLANALADEHANECKATIPDVPLSQSEFDLFCGDFAGQYGVTAFRNSGIRRNLLAGRYRAACESLLDYRFMTSPTNLGPGWKPRDNGPGFKFDCSQHINGKRNTLCWGVWTRQERRHATCIAEQDRIDWLSGTRLNSFEVLQ